MAPPRTGAPGDSTAPEATSAERAWTRWRELLQRLRGNAPDLEWVFPTRHVYRSEPPPALGHGSLPTNAANPPQLSDQQIAANLDRRRHQLANNQARRRVLHLKRLKAPSVLERELYLTLHHHTPTGPDG